MIHLTNFLEFELINIGQYSIKTYTILSIIIILAITKGLVWLIEKTLFRKNKYNYLDSGNAYALFQIIKYVIWIICFAFLLDIVGIKITVFLAGSAALLVGLGMGLQQTFNDLISGIILLTERSIKVDDILEIDNDIVKIQEIGLRTSRGLNRDEISIIIPNSLITTNKVINWSHQTKKTRFKIEIGLAYSSDIDLIIKTLKKSVEQHPQILHNRLIDVRLIRFNNSSLDFEVYFYSENVFRIEKVKSDIRINISRNLEKQNLSIPFPQLDVRIKK